MLKVLAKTIVGMLLLAMGFGLIYYYLSTINTGSSALLLIPALGIIIGGIFVLMNAGKSDETVAQKLQEPPQGESVNTGEKKESLIERNNTITENWLKSSEKRDKLRLLEMAATEEENKPFQGS